jgi:hypothetical protein
MSVSLPATGSRLSVQDALAELVEELTARLKGGESGRGGKVVLSTSTETR